MSIPNHFPNSNLPSILETKKMLKSDNPESPSFRPLPDARRSTPDFHDLRPSDLSPTDRLLFFILLFFSGLFKIFAIFFFACFFLIQLLRPQVLYRLQDELGLLDPISQTSILFGPPLTSGPYQLADLENIKDVLEDTEENLEALQSAIGLVETQFRDLQLKHQRTRRVLPFLDVDDGDKIADALSNIVSWGFVESEPRIEFARAVEDTIHRLQHPDLSFQSDLQFMWFTFRAGIYSHPYP
ncbi:hypothetical protein NLI96_g7764 [Meripilus lineatus]|uniref:Uncharacterized protein n=1 Tax=Meripilus lineatus TaxID=2056292 RepID=A0AAD5YEL9_9APHY|nr:hypothetical protein NLI96_g7764 [Physisporinus lineatus]